MSHAANAPDRAQFRTLTLAALGVVFGDIGTSPLYAIREIFASSHHPVPISPDNVLGILSLGIAAGLALLLTGTLNVVVIMLVVTTCGIGFSFIRKVRSAPGAYTVGQYLILMFSFGIGLSFQFGTLNQKAFLLVAMMATAQFGSILLHLLLCKVFRVDADTALITSTAGIYGPAFIVPVADAMENREVVLPGLICGILGYAIGNYLGIGIAIALRFFGG